MVNLSVMTDDGPNFTKNLCFFGRKMSITVITQKVRDIVYIY